MLTFLHREHSPCYRISSVLSSYTHAVVEEMFKMHAVVHHVGIAPLANFDRGDHFHLLQRDSCWAVMGSE